MSASTIRPSARRIRAGHMLWFGVLVVLIVVAIVDYDSVAATARAAIRAAANASAWWLTAGLGLTVASMVAFGWLRQLTVHATGSRLTLRQATAISYEAGAISLTAPAGVVASTAHAYRRMTRAGVAAAGATWSLTVSGVACTATLLALGAVGLSVGSGIEADTGFVPIVLTAAALAMALVLAVRHPDIVTRLATGVLRRVNRLLHCPADAGVAGVRRIVADLRAIRPRRTDWALSVAAATANWLLDLLCLWACARALGIDVAPWLLVAGYALAMTGAGAAPLPGGVGVVDGILAVTLTGAAHASAAAALAAVLLYRTASYGSVLAVGWAAVGLQATHRRRAVPIAYTAEHEGALIVA